ncbi:MAG: GntG family PLP-dependent aldolase [Candidatus Poribacteria bacterium]|nr:GntG family PLP-dependent aldolase [Candidatus Poribacteria bacterium]
MSIIDLRSDTMTRPTPQMREAMANAVVGDDIYGEDPTVTELETRAAEIMGKESAMYIPSGTMGNLVALLVHGKPGDIALMDKECHIYVYEQGGVAAFAGLTPGLWESENGCPSPDFVQSYVGRNTRAYPPMGLVCLENTHNRRGGTVIPPDQIKAVHEVTLEAGVPLHMDGARIFNAAIALGVSVKEIADQVDTVQFCLSKGLGAPVGSILAGSERFIVEARRVRRRLGGAMRQSGVIAAAGLIALTEMPARLRDDHANARLLVERLSELDALELEPDKAPTNIVVVRTDNLSVGAEEVAELLKEKGVLVTLYGPQMIRFVTHHDVSREQVQSAAEITLGVLKSLVA